MLLELRVFQSLVSWEEMYLMLSAHVHTFFHCTTVYKHEECRNMDYKKLVFPNKISYFKWVSLHDVPLWNWKKLVGSLFSSGTLGVILLDLDSSGLWIVILLGQIWWYRLFLINQNRFTTELLTYRISQEVYRVPCSHVLFLRPRDFAWLGSFRTCPW